MKKNPHANLSRRERQIMDVLYRLGRATAAEVREQMPDPPGYSAVRAMLRVLEEKGHIRHEEEALRYVFAPTASRAQATRSALAHLVDTFFEGSTERAVAALLDGKLSHHASGAVVPGAKVTIVKADTGLTQTIESGPAGNYSFPDVPSGSYQVKVGHPGFEVYVYDAVAVPTVFDVKLRLGRLVESMVVSGKRSQAAP